MDDFIHIRVTSVVRLEIAISSLSEVVIHKAYKDKY